MSKTTFSLFIIYSMFTKLLLPFALILLITACNKAITMPTPLPITEANVVETAVLPTVTSPPLPTNTPSPTNTSRPTATAIATKTPIPIMTPTFYHPVEHLASTPLPMIETVLLPENIMQIQEVSRWGKGRILDAIYSPDGNQIIAATPLGIYFYDAHTATLQDFILTQHEVSMVALAPNGHLIAIGYAGSGDIDVYNKSTWVNRLAIGKDEIIQISFMLDNQTILVGTKTQLFEWNLVTGQNTTLPTGNGYWDIATDGKTAVSTSNETFYQWQNIDGSFSQTQSTITPDGETDLSVLSPNGTLLAIAEYWGVRVWLWDVSHQTLLYTFDATPEEVTARLKHHSASPVQHSGPGDWYISDIDFSPDGKTLAITSGFQEVTLWNLKNGSLKGRISQAGTKAAFSSTSEKLITWQHTLHQWDLNANLYINSLDGHAGPIRDIAFLPSRKLLAASSDDGHIYLHNINDGTVVKDYIGCDGGVFSLAVSPNDLQLAAGSGSKLCVWNLENNTSYTMPASFSAWGVADVAISSDGQYVATASHEDDIRLRLLNNGKLIQEGYSFYGSIAFSPISPLLATQAQTNQNDIVAIWQVSAEDSILLQTLNDQSDESTSPEGISFSPNGRLLAIGTSNGRVLIWNLEDGSLQYTLNNQTSYVRGIAFSPDGQLLATAAFDRTINFWRLSDGALVHTIHMPHDIPHQVIFSPDGHLLAISLHDGTVRIWAIP